MSQLTIVVIEVGWWCWPSDDRWYAGGWKYTESKRGMMDVETQIKGGEKKRGGEKQ